MKKKTLKKSSENDQSTGHFRAFLLIFFVPPTLDLKKISRKSTNKKSGLKGEVGAVKLVHALK